MLEYIIGGSKKESEFRWSCQENSASSREAGCVVRLKADFTCLDMAVLQTNKYLPHSADGCKQV